MSSMFKLSAVSVLCLGLMGCSTVTTTAYQTKGGNYQAVSLSRSENDGAPAALEKAKDICEKQNKQLIVLSNKTRYQGTNKELGEVSDVVSKAAFQAGGVLVPSLKQDNDYKTVLTFRCK